MGKINTDNYPNRPFVSYQDDDMFILQDNGGETYTTNVGDIKNLADSRIKLEGVQVNGTDLPISGKKVNVDISGKTDLRVIAFPFHDPEPGEPSMGFFKGAYVTYNGKLYEFTQEHQGAWNPSHVREIDVDGMYVRAGNGGYNTGRYSTTEGSSTRAEGEAAHAEGIGTIANSDYQHAEGKYNIADTDDEYALIVGNGTADNARSNAMTLDWDGNLEVSGEVEDGNGEKISDKTDKVTNATAGHLAGLDSNGNLTDSGVSPTEDVTVEGNPVTFDSPFEQDAKSVVVSVEPIQDLHGYDHPWPAGGGKNKWSYGNITTETESYVPLSLSAGTYTLSGVKSTNNIGLTIRFNYIDETSKLCSYINVNGETITFDKDVVSFNFSVAGFSSGDTITNIQIEAGSQATSYAPYSNICPISGIDELEIGVSNGESEPTTTTIPLPSTLYGGTVDVTEGSGNSTHAIVDLSTLSWTLGSGKRWATSPINTMKSVGDSTVANAYCSTLPIDTKNNITNDESIIALSINSTSQIIARNGSETDPPTGQLVYELATTTTLSLTPTDVELLEGTNVVSTNAEKVAVTYGRSLWQDIDDLKTDTEGKLNKSDVADVEGDTASRPYSVNEFMLRSDGFYKVTQPIAQNASITSSNTTKTTIGAVLTALLNS